MPQPQPQSLVTLGLLLFWPLPPRVIIWAQVLCLTYYMWTLVGQFTLDVETIIELHFSQKSTFSRVFTWAPNIKKGPLAWTSNKTFTKICFWPIHMVRREDKHARSETWSTKEKGTQFLLSLSVDITASKCSAAEISTVFAEIRYFIHL